MPLLNAIVDLSHHNTVTSFEEARADGVLAIIHKATEGTTFVDAKYAERQARAKAAGLLWGAYHFGTKGAAPEQVSHFLETANPTATDLLVLDFEPNSREATMTLTEAEVFVEALRERTGRQPGLYSGQSFLRERLGNRVDSPLTDCFLWIARYSVQLPVLPKAFERFTIWQYTDGSSGLQPHQVTGIGRCDRDKFNGDEAELRKFWGQDA
jgi:GH25 family lysozyme M1 (1,4-beta-N-acetylmuramidase)